MKDPKAVSIILHVFGVLIIAYGLIAEDGVIVGIGATVIALGGIRTATWAHHRIHDLEEQLEEGPP